MPIRKNEFSDIDWNWILLYAKRVEFVTDQRPIWNHHSHPLAQFSEAFSVALINIRLLCRCFSCNGEAYARQRESNLMFMIATQRPVPVNKIYLQTF